MAKVRQLLQRGQQAAVPVQPVVPHAVAPPPAYPPLNLPPDLIAKVGERVGGGRESGWRACSLQGWDVG